MVIFLLSSWGIICQVRPVLTPTWLSCEFQALWVCVCVCVVFYACLSPWFTSTKISSSPVIGRGLDNLEDAHDSTCLLRYMAELGKSFPLHLKLFLEYDHVFFKMKSEENCSSVIFIHLYCLERLWMALSPPSRTKRSQFSPRESRGSWSWQFLASKDSTRVCGATWSGRGHY